MSLKFLVCTLYCGEPDLEHCLRSLSQQDIDVEIDHRIISFLPEHAAHVVVYKTFNDTDDSWFKLKLDADVVLEKNALSSINEAFKCPSTMWVDPIVHDYFTDSLIHAGIAAYRGSVKFNMPTSTLKCDRNIHSECATQVGRVGKHAFYASDFEAFRYGFHRGLKGQKPLYDMIVKAYSVHKDHTRLMAMRGFQVAFSDMFSDWHTGRITEHPNYHSYGDKVLMDLFKEFSVDSPPQLRYCIDL